MRLLIDTHILLWYLHNDKRLSKNAVAAINSNYTAVSIASLWEISIKKAIGKLMIDESVTDIAQMCSQKKIDIFPISVSSIEGIQKLPMLHNDPFDRIIIATALEEGMSLVTDDGMIKKYDLDVLC